jgi:rubrerythrin
MFTIEDIRNIAIQIEKNGEETYRNASKAAKDPEVAKILAWMADEERHHAQWFSGLKSDKTLTPEQQEMERMGRALLQDMIKGNNFLINENELQNAKTVEEVVARSITLELDTILFYEFLINFLDDQEAIVQLQKIIKEERNHIKQLEGIDTPKSCESCSCP